MDPVQLIRDDHNQMRALFQAFDEAPDHRTKERLAKQLILTLEIHETVEEEILYGQLRALDDTADLIAAAEAEHHDADRLMLAVSEMPRGDNQYDARVASLNRAVEHHIDREEAEILPKAYLLDPALLRDMAEQVEKRRHELLSRAPYLLASRRTNRTRHTTRATGRDSRKAHAG
jgi:hemerythrin HHE cation binding domain-containing protein